MIPNLSKLDANGCYHISLDLSVLGSEADEVPVELDGQYHVVGWVARVAMGGDQSAGRYLNCATHFDFYSQDEMNIPISSSHDIEIVGTPTATYQDFSGDSVVTENLPADSYTINTTGNSKVTVSHVMNTDLASMSKYDVSKITYTFTIQHKGDGGSAYQKDITVIQYPSIYIEADPNSGASQTHEVRLTDSSNRSYRYYYNASEGYVLWSNSNNNSFNYGGYNFSLYQDYYYCGYTFVNTVSHSTTTSVQVHRNGSLYNNTNITYTGDHNFLPPYTGPNDWTRTSGLAHSNNTNSNMYVITTKVLSNASQVIGDPRGDAGNAITSYSGWVTAPGYEGSTGRTLQAYKQVESSERTMNMVAPKLRTASSFGATSDFSFEDATRRCAGYQEDGLPAGRWRLPTAAEIEFLVNLSAQHFLPRLFGSATGDTNYWCANGYVTVNNENNTVDSETGKNDFSGTQYIRCVYDEWYWEGKRLPASQRHTFTWGDEIN